MSSAASTLSCSSSTTGPPSIGSSQSSRSRLTQEEDDDEASVHPTAMAPHAKGEASRGASAASHSNGTPLCAELRQGSVPTLPISHVPQV
ncbi:Hypothetical protein NocV09_07500140 [Nannochloropsis oceanica]